MAENKASPYRHTECHNEQDLPWIKIIANFHVVFAFQTVPMLGVRKWHGPVLLSLSFVFRARTVKSCQVGIRCQ